jgi:hypothetical protein
MMTVLDFEAGEEVATPAGKFEPALFAHYVVVGVSAAPLVLMYVVSLNKEDKSGRHRRRRHGHRHGHRTQVPDTAIKPADGETGRVPSNREGITAQKTGDDRVRPADTSFMG